MEVFESFHYTFANVFLINWLGILKFFDNSEDCVSVAVSTPD